MNFERQQAIESAATVTGGVVSRRVLRGLGITHDDVRTEQEAGRWRVIGNQTVVPHRGPVPVEGRYWSTIWETGTSIAALDGVTALQVAGLRNYRDDEIHVSVVHRCAVKRAAGVQLHKVIRRVPGEVLTSGIPRTRPAVAALRAAYWAASDRQAALVLIMTVQQGLATPEQLLAWSKRLRGRRRRAFIKDVIFYISAGVRALGELDFARLCREWDLPEPSRQVVVDSRLGRSYLDVRWDGFALVLEIDGVQHREGLQVSADNLTRNEVTLRADRVLRIDLIGLRLHRDEFMSQVARGLGLGSRYSSRYERSPDVAS
ncbi:hypothetical protein ACWEOW_22250 [Monashia sp. NPDC004114]